MYLHLLSSAFSAAAVCSQVPDFSAHERTPLFSIAANVASVMGVAACAIDAIAAIPVGSSWETCACTVLQRLVLAAKQFAFRLLCYPVFALQQH